MTPDTHTACVACPRIVRELLEADEAHLDTLAAFLATLPPEHRRGRAWARMTETAVVVRQRTLALRPWYDAHHGNQFHRDSPELADARVPVLVLAPPEAVLPW